MWSVGEADCVVPKVFSPFSTEGSNLAAFGQMTLDNYTGNTLASGQQLGLLPQGVKAPTQHPMAAA